MVEFLMPPVLKDSDGNERRVGVELEFGDAPIKETASALQSRLGGDLRFENPYVAHLENTPLGDLRIERDAELLNTVPYREWLKSLDIDFDAGTLAAELEQGVDALSSRLVPAEVVTEPLPMSELKILHPLIEALTQLGASGTDASWLNAYGLHFNPSVPDCEADTLTAYTQAFALLYPRFIDAGEIDKTRRWLTSYINPFPNTYLARILTPDYQPDQTGFIDDYLKDNADRNRALDLLPLLKNIDADRVESALPEAQRSLVKARPAFHYRLSDCRIGDPNWQIEKEWRRWWQVEQLAHDDSMRQELLSAWSKAQDDAAYLAQLDTAMAQADWNQGG
ncbi:amidoligase family protein [Ferrimonas gelatinilytica]|uniref:Amidoligase enzyme n=1 Tax=Ferrimonas gelatinilytica TaxID=1255257 RepID=A0ABP9S4X4_9GAMM